MGLEKAIEQGDITHMSKYIKLPKTGADDSPSSGPMPYELPCNQEKDNPNIESTTTSAVKPCETSETGSEVPISSSDAWEQFRRVMSKNDQTTLLAWPPKLISNKRAARRNLRDEYLSNFPELLKAVSDDKRAKGETTMTYHAPVADMSSVQKEKTIAES